MEETKNHAPHGQMRKSGMKVWIPVLEKPEEPGLNNKMR